MISAFYTINYYILYTKMFKKSSFVDKVHSDAVYFFPEIVQIFLCSGYSLKSGCELSTLYPCCDYIVIDGEAHLVTCIGEGVFPAVLVILRTGVLCEYLGEDCDLLCIQML